MKKRIKIEVRAAELADVEALTRIYADRNAYSQTLQLPFQSLEVWRKRLTTNDDTQVTLVAAVAGEVVGNLGLRASRARAARMSARSAWACATTGRARASARP